MLSVVAKRGHAATISIPLEVSRNTSDCSAGDLVAGEPPDEEKPIVQSTLQSASESLPGLVPRNHAHGSSVDLLKTAVNLVSPGFLHVPIDPGIVSICIQAFKQRVDQRDARFDWKRKCISEQFGRLGSHGLIVPPSGS
jgi:hypothetical protein